MHYNMVDKGKENLPYAGGADVVYWLYFITIHSFKN
jgi:hypothetical protein